MDNVTIVVTKKGWTTTAKLGKKTYQEVYKRTPTGAECVSGNFENEEGISDELYDRLTGFSQYDIMEALNNL